MFQYGALFKLLLYCSCQPKTAHRLHQIVERIGTASRTALTRRISVSRAREGKHSRTRAKVRHTSGSASISCSMRWAVYPWPARLSAALLIPIQVSLLNSPRSLRHRMFLLPPRGFADNETSDCLLGSATRGHRPAGGRRMPVGLPANRADWGRIALLHAAASPCIRFMFNARHTRAHSPCAWFKPRTLKRRKPSACLIQPLGASDSHLRLA